MTVAKPDSGRSGILMITAVIGFAVAMGLALTLMYGRGFSARDTPSTVEVMLARAARKLAVPKNAVRARNPVAPSVAVLREAEEHFADHCATCHGNDGSGNTDIGQRFYPKVPDMRRSETQSLSDGELFYIISNGIRLSGMPAWGSGRPDEDSDSWKLVYFIRYLPKISRDELRRMKALNPISRRAMIERNNENSFLLGGAPPVLDNTNR